MRRHALALVVLAVAVPLAAAPAKHPSVLHPAADSLMAAADEFFFASQYDSILHLVPSYLHRAQASGDSLLLGRALTQRGRARLMVGQRAEAERDMDAGIHIAEAVRDTMGLMPALHFRAYAYSAASRNEDALRCFERRLLLAQRTNSQIDEAWARSGMGYILHLLDRQAEAKESYTRSIELFHAAGTTKLEISPLIGLGRVEGAIGHNEMAMQCYKRAWVAARATGDKLDEMWAANNLGALESNGGDLSLAAQYHRRAYDLSRELNAPNAMVIPALNVASRAEELGDFETAEHVLTDTRDFYVSHGGGDFLSMLDLKLGELRLAQGRNQAAIAILRPLVDHPELLEPQHRDEAVTYFASALAAVDSVDAAITLLSKTVNSREARMYAYTVPRAYLLLARLHHEAGHDADALRYSSLAQTTAGPTGLRHLAVQAMLQKSVCERAIGNTGAAAATFYAALDSMEAFRGGITTPDWREMYGQEVAGSVVDAASVLLVEPSSQAQAARDEAFFNAVQRVKSRTLLDRIAEPRPNATTTEHAWSRRVATLRDTRAALEPGEAILDFCVGSRRAFLMVVTRDNARLVELPGRGSPLADHIRLLRTVLVGDDAGLRAQFPPEHISPMQRAVAQEILGPVADVVDESQRLFISADGFLATLPFGVLVVRDGDDVLMSDHDVLQIPSATVLVLERSAKNACAGAVPELVAIESSSKQLRGARDEVRDLVRDYQNVRTVAGSGGIDGFASAAVGCDVMHIASHALVVDRSPWQSGFMFADTTSAVDTRAAAPHDIAPGFLSLEDSLAVAKAFRSDPYVRAWQIARLRLGAQLAVLSGCETAGGRVTTGEGTLGLTAAFLSAGVPVVVSSLWPIDDHVTRILMRSFYRHLSNGEPVATALRHAQLEIRRSPRYAHPYFWAGFTVMGDGARVIGVERSSPWPAIVLVAVSLLITVVVAIRIGRRRTHPSVG